MTRLVQMKVVDEPIILLTDVESDFDPKSTTASIGFFTRDPIGFEGSEWNLYEFCDGSPLDHTDAHGMQAVNCNAKSADCIAGAGVNDDWCKGRIKPLCFTYCVLLLRQPPWSKNPVKDGCLKLTPVLVCEAACEPIYEAACDRDLGKELGCCAASLAYCNANGSWPGFLWRAWNGCRS